MKWVIISSTIILGLLVLFSIIAGFFNGWSFFGIIFCALIYLGGYLYVKIGMDNRASDLDTVLQRRQKFEFCWERINEILKSMAGGQGIEWASGVGKRSGIKSYYDGVQNKPFRSVIAHLENTQQLVIIIFDIEGDDISEFITNPSAELIDNPFLNFRPYARSVEREEGLDRYGGHNGLRSGMDYRRNSSQKRRGFSINVEDGFGDFEGGQQKTTPKKNIVDNAIDKLKK